MTWGLEGKLTSPLEFPFTERDHGIELHITSVRKHFIGKGLLTS